MKKILIFVALLAFSGGAYAQQLCIDNSADPCDVYVTMHAQDPSASPADGPCSTYSNQFTVLAGASVCWTTVYVFQSGSAMSVGWASIPSGSISAASTQFNWTDVSFQFNCPLSVLAGPCSNTGGTMTDPNITGGCFSSGATWNSGAMGCRSASWADGCTLGCYFDDVTLTFR